MSKPKILITYATAGIGHKKAALAVKQAFESRDRSCDLKTIDILDYTNPFFKWAYPRVYLFFISRLPFLWGFLYYSMDFKIPHYAFYIFRKYAHVLNSIRFIKFLLKYRPDIVLSTHFLTADICEYVKRKYGMRIQVINVITDYKPHSFWISKGVDRYIVAHEETKSELCEKWGVPGRIIEITGIPVEAKFSIRHDKFTFKKKFGIPANNFAVLFLSGGYGVGPIFRMLEVLNHSAGSLSAIVICGHNKSLYERIESFRKTAKIHIVNFGYVNNVDELMAASDVYVGKAGGISTTEALVMELPLIYVSPIPGQETRNVDFIVKKNAGRRLKRAGDIFSVMRKLQNSKELSDKLKKNAGMIGNRKAASDIADYALKITKRAEGV